MDKTIENILIEFVIKTSDHFNLSYEDALATVTQSKVANEIAAHGNPENRTSEELFAELFDEISKG
ncbi:MAG: hypothetical protein HDS10_03530 [Bacteroides sp.]|nr:hypothetical protein [Bacteroides sp.]